VMPSWTCSFCLARAIFTDPEHPDPPASSTDRTVRVWIGDTPPSLNVIAGRGSRFAFARAKRRWQTDLGLLLMAEALPRDLDRVEASAVLSFPTRRRRDEGNFRALLEKALGDALVEGVWLPDDTPDRFSFGAITFAEGAARTTLEMRVSVRSDTSGSGRPNGANTPNMGGRR
jgi:hypothetical protein